jgi:hypothetical protein
MLELEARMAAFVSSSSSETKSCVSPADMLKLPYKISPAKKQRIHSVLFMIISNSAISFCFSMLYKLSLQQEAEYR